MSKHVKILISGLVISFLGSLPLGTLNTTAFQISASQSTNEAIVFAFAVVIVELTVVYITLIYASKINFKSKLFSYILPVSIVLLVYLSISNFMSFDDSQHFSKTSYVFPLIKSSFLLGLLLSILNPLHIPFWMGWNSILIEKRKLNNAPGMYPSYISGIGLGSLGSLMIFIFAGKFIYQNYQQYNYIIAFIMGCLYLGFSFYLFVIFYKNHLKLNTI